MKKQIDSQACASPCKTCPFLKANFGKPNPEGYNPKAATERNPDQIFHDWYSRANLLRIWRGGLSQGEGMLCHASDPEADSYGGKKGKAGSERLCVGSLVAVFRHIDLFQQACRDVESGTATGTAYAVYKRRAGKYPLSKSGLQDWVMMIAIGRTHLMGGLAVPRSISGHEHVGVQWDDPAIGKNDGLQKTMQNGLPTSR